MKIVTASDKSLKELLKYAKREAKKYGYKYLIYDLGDLGYGRSKFKGVSFKNAPKTDIIANLWKPSVILDAFDTTKDDIAWLDADAIFWNSFHDDSKCKDKGIDWMFDVGVTLRRKGETKNAPNPNLTGYLNSGVVFFKHSKPARDFIVEWKDRCENGGITDQQVLNEMVGECTDFRSYKTYERKNAKIKLYPTEVYNCYYFRQPLNNLYNRIIHFKGDRRQIFYSDFKDIFDGKK